MHVVYLSDDHYETFANSARTVPFAKSYFTVSNQSVRFLVMDVMLYK